jgi:hypothetical protein
MDKFSTTYLQVQSLRKATLPPSDAGLARLIEYLDYGRNVRSFTISVHQGDVYTLPFDGAQVKRRFVDTYWMFFDWRVLVPGGTYNLLALDANDGKSNARFPLCLVDAIETDSLAEQKKFSAKWYDLEKAGKYLSAAAAHVSATRSLPIEEYEAAAEPIEMLLNSKDGTVNLGLMVTGGRCSFWVPINEYIRLAPNVTTAKALLEQGSR